MSMAYIREYYKVPAKRGGRVLINGWAGTIIGAAGQYIKVRYDGSRVVRLFHPTWRVTYFKTPNMALLDAANPLRSKVLVAAMVLFHRRASNANPVGLLSKGK